MTFRDELNHNLRQVCLDRMKSLGWSFRDLARHTLGKQTPTLSEISALRTALTSPNNGTVLAYKGVNILTTLGCQTLQPVWDRPGRPVKTPLSKAQPHEQCPPIIKALNNQVRDRIASQGLSQAQAARRIGLAPNALHDILAGKILVLSSNGVRLLESLGLQDLVPLWGEAATDPGRPPARTRPRKVTVTLSLLPEEVEALERTASHSDLSVSALVTRYVVEALDAEPLPGQYSAPVVARFHRREWQQLQAQAKQRGETPEQYVRNAVLAATQLTAWTPAQLRAIQAEATSTGHLWTLEELEERRLPLFWNEDWVRARLREGRSPGEIAELAGGWQVRTVHHYVLTTFGIHLRKPQMDPKTAAYIRDQVAAGRSRLDVADEVGVSRSVVAHHTSEAPSELQRRFERQVAQVGKWPATTREIAEALFNGNGNRASSWGRDMIKSGRLVRVQHGYYDLAPKATAGDP